MLFLAVSVLSFGHIARYAPSLPNKNISKITTLYIIH